ncbi:copper chaperone PCu(A)C [Rubrivivax sp. A210]|uniref:copper chaperone PCu(A)C n=1 Tax=Rubrivivax sp. A210 TaxID=2772301 RepID=UPI003986A0B8
MNHENRKTMKLSLALPLALSMTLLLATSASLAQTQVKDAWVRGTVPQQKATGVFAQITSAAGGRLVSASSPVAARTELHSMVLDGTVARMRQIPALELPAGAAVDLKPGGYHIMLIDLKQQLQPGDTVPLTLVVEGAGGKRETLELNAPVRHLASGAMHVKP